MGILQNTFKLNEKQRKTIAVLACIIVLTSSKVETVVAAETSSTLPLTGTEDVALDDDASRGIILPPSYLGEAPPAPPVAPSVTPLRTYVVEMTAYNSEVGQCDDSPFITANGTHVRDGIVATNFLKFNTKIRIPELYGDKVFTVTDRMNKRYTTRVDIWMEKKSDALKFGLKRNVKIEIIEEAPAKVAKK
jgi:3D (Asp-Asp-Asp) domain-containing protein